MTFRKGDKVKCVKRVQDSGNVLNKIGIVNHIHPGGTDDTLLHVFFDYDDDGDFDYGWNVYSSALKLYKPDPLIQALLKVIR
jgi:hypothetical protein